MNFSIDDIDYLGQLYRHERHNSYVYSQVSNFLNVQGYKKLAKYYEDWSQHEIEHSMKVRDFANANNILIDMNQDIKPLDMDLSNQSITTFAKITVDVENETSEMYDVYLKMGIKDGNSFIQRFCYDFQLEQIEETDKATSIFDSVKNIGDNRSMLQLFDNSFEG